MSVAIVTDSNSGLTAREAEQYGIRLLPMPFSIGGTTYYEDVSVSREEFFARLRAGEDIVTSQPTPGDVMDLWEELLKTHDSVLHLPMSSGLSGSCATAQGLAAQFNGRVRVVDNRRISVPLLQSLLDARCLVKQGKDANEIGRILEDTADDNAIFITVDTLTYLKKGGRITPLAAAVGTVLNIKPVLQINGGKLDAYAKVRGMKQAKETMVDALRKTMETRFADVDPATGLWLQAAHTVDEETALAWKAELEAAFPGMTCRMAPLGLSIACHTGEGVLACALTKRMFR